MNINGEGGVKRQPAVKLKISDIINGQYVKKEGWSPNYVVTNYGNVSRVNFIAAVISKDLDQNRILVDDGSSNINIKSFEDWNFDVDIGDIVLVIGKPREWNSEKYIVPEIVKKLKDKKWVEIRKLELKNREPIERTEEVSSEEAEEEFFESPYEKIIKLIRNMDKGDGALYQEVIVKSNLKEGEKFLKQLLEQGEIFEIRPGKLKVLE